MSKWGRLHPLTIFLYYIAVIGILMFEQNPILTLAGLVGAVLGHMSEDIKFDRKNALWLMVIFFAATIVNPLFNHNGATVLFYLNKQRITLEAFLYGANMSFIILTVILQCRVMSRRLDSGRVLYLIGKISNSAALVLSMTLRFVPMFTRQAREIRESRRFLGDNKDDTFWDRLAFEMKVFSATTTWALEHSMETSDSISSRAYGTKRRTAYSLYCFKMRDAIFCGFIFAAFTGMLICIYLNSFHIFFYPEFRLNIFESRLIAGSIIFLLLTALPELVLFED